MIEPQFYSHLASKGRATSTIRAYRWNLEHLRLTHPNLHTVTAEQLEAYLAARQFTHKPETRKAMRTAFKAYYRWATRTHRIPTDPAAELDPIPIPHSLIRVATDDQVLHGLIAADDRTRAMILLARYACLRLTELTTLHTSQRRGDLLYIRGKGSKERVVPINENLMRILLKIEREQSDGYYFQGRFGGHMHPQAVYKIIQRTTGTNPHSLRHAGATAAYVATGDLEALRLFLGHSSIATTQRYLHVGVDAIRTVAAATAIVTHADFTPRTTSVAA